MLSRLLTVFLSTLLLPRSPAAFDSNAYISVHDSGFLHAAHMKASAEASASQKHGARSFSSFKRIKHSGNDDELAAERQVQNMKAVSSAAHESYLNKTSSSTWKCYNICIRCKKDHEEWHVEIKRAQSLGTWFKHLGKFALKALSLGALHFWFNKYKDECPRIEFNGKLEGTNQEDKENLLMAVKKNYIALYKKEPHLLYQFIARSVCGGLSNLVAYQFDRPLCPVGKIHQGTRRDRPLPSNPAHGKAGCAADYGTQVGQPVCCGQKGKLERDTWACPKDYPICKGYVADGFLPMGTCHPPNIMQVAAKYMEVDLGPFKTAAEACAYCIKSWKGTNGANGTDESARSQRQLDSHACTCMQYEHAKDKSKGTKKSKAIKERSDYLGEYNMFCATEPEVQDALDDGKTMCVTEDKSGQVIPVEEA